MNNLSESIDRYTAGEMSEAERSCFEEILQTHPLLRAEVRLDRELTRCLEDHEAMAFAQQLHALRNQPRKKGFPLRYLSLAASLLLLVSITLFIFYQKKAWIPEFYRQRGSDELIDRKVTQHPFSCFNTSRLQQKLTPVTRRQMMKNRALAQHFRPLPEYELLIGSISRSFSLKVLSPKSRLTLPYQSTITFEWVAPGTCSFLILQITDNKGKKVFDTAPLQDNSYLLNTGNFRRGLYYWKLIQDEELVSMGCFTLH